MAGRHACAALICVLAGISVLGPGPGQAADLVVHGRAGDAFFGIDTRDGKRRGGFDRRDRAGHRGDRRDFVDPDLGDRDFKERLERRFEREKLFNGGSGSFPEDRRRRALEGWPPPREKRRDRRDRRRDRGFSGVLLHGSPYYYYDDDRYYDDDPYGDDPYGDGDGLSEEAAGFGGEGRARQAAPEGPATRAVPPDARGPRFEAARRPPSVPAVGERLPPGQPHVALDWKDYGLPEPPPGQSYVRFDGAVLLIETGTRIVREVLWPTG